MYALEEPLNHKFLDLAKRCQAVLCCRATPLQKVSCDMSGSNNFFLVVFLTIEASGFESVIL